MQRIQQSEATAARRRVALDLRQEDGQLEWDGVVTGIKAKLSIGGAAAVDSTNDIVKLAAGMCYLELTTAELATVGPIFVKIVALSASTGMAPLMVTVLVVAADPY